MTDKLESEFSCIMNKIANMRVHGVQVSSYDMRTAVVAAYLLGKTETLIAIKTAIEDELYDVIFKDVPKE